jgi:hypothetical protein
LLARSAALSESARQPNATLKTELQWQLPLLERVLKRVNDACVMF